MAFYVYVLFSRTSNRFYCGSTRNLQLRIKQHNHPEYTGTLTTKRFKGPWELIWKDQLPSRSDAMRLEKKIKKRGIKRFITESSAGRVPPGRD
ncbi:MAG: GIY-YIG nuclease family protein [candidate division Zixibacteria bacterium]|nr:GIY-YIG nuclease family protein [candidate division Zixibacteria bacterium]